MFLFFEDEWWVKNNDPSFDVSMGSLDSAEVCELVGLVPALTGGEPHPSEPAGALQRRWPRRGQSPRARAGAAK